MKNILTQLLRKNKRIKEKTLYAITGGDYVGRFILFLEENETTYGALLLGEPGKGLSTIEIPKKDVQEGLENKILDKVKKLSAPIFSICQTEYNNIKSEELADELRRRDQLDVYGSERDDDELNY